MTDKELLEFAAKAAGIELGDWSSAEDGFIRYHFITRHIWNPLNDDGDEMRLETALSMEVDWHPGLILIGLRSFTMCAEFFNKHDGDKHSARRKAGVRAAAEIGKAMTSAA